MKSLATMKIQSKKFWCGKITFALPDLNDVFHRKHFGAWTRLTRDHKLLYLDDLCLEYHDQIKNLDDYELDKTAALLFRESAKKTEEVRDLGELLREENNQKDRTESH